MEFIEQVMGLETFLSHPELENLVIDESFDIMFALSLFTHFSDRTWGRWLSTMYSLVALDGILIFTIHGRKCTHIFDNPAIPDSGFRLLMESEQNDLPFTEYGRTITLMEYVINKVF